MQQNTAEGNQCAFATLGLTEAAYRQTIDPIKTAHTSADGLLGDTRAHAHTHAQCHRLAWTSGTLLSKGSRMGWGPGVLRCVMCVIHVHTSS